VVISVPRNEVRVFRIRLDAGQQLDMTFDPDTGDVDVSVFDQSGNRLLVSANNGDTAETVSLTSAADNTVFHVEVRAVVNSRFTIQTAQLSGIAARAMVPMAIDKADPPDTPINLGPPPQQAAIDLSADIFLPLIAR
jgi:hypothetical protein